MHPLSVPEAVQPLARPVVAALMFVLILLAQACAPTPGIKPQAPPDLGPELSRAKALEAAGEYTSAAALYRGLAHSLPPPGRQDLLLQAAGSLFRAEDLAGAADLLSSIDTDGLAPEYGFRKRLQRAQIDLAEGRIHEALAHTEHPPPADTGIPLRRRYHQTRAEALELSGNLLESARQLSELDPLLPDQPQRMANQVAIIQRLTSLSDRILESLQPAPPDRFGGWMALALIFKTPTPQAGDIRHRLDDWRRQYPEHPALPLLPETYLQTRQARYLRLGNIAILLPQTGRYAKVAAALRDGLMAAYFHLATQQRPVLRFYDSGNPADVWPLYQQAVADGADFVIGPLNKKAVAQLRQAGDPEIPVLALNQLPLDAPPSKDFFLFSLSPEGEARQVAEKAWLDGFSRAAILTPTGGWGDRLFRSFRDRWEALGGVIAEHQTYDENDDDFSNPIRKLLNLDESDKRRRLLQQTLGKNVKFEPRRRRDVDFIFLAAHAEKAREIRPQLQFYFAADLPVYTTSHAYAPDQEPGRNQDLEGLEFPDIPWLLAAEGDTGLSRKAFFQAMPASDVRYVRFYAMGIDSLNLLPQLLRLSASSVEMYDGKTGTLYLDPENRIHRRLIWARMRPNGPQVLGYAPRLPTDMGIAPPLHAGTAPIERSGSGALRPPPANPSPTAPAAAAPR